MAKLHGWQEGIWERAGSGVLGGRPSAVEVSEIGLNVSKGDWSDYNMFICFFVLRFVLF